MIINKNEFLEKNIFIIIFRSKQKLKTKTKIAKKFFKYLFRQPCKILKIKKNATLLKKLIKTFNKNLTFSKFFLYFFLFQLCNSNLSPHDILSIHANTPT